MRRVEGGVLPENEWTLMPYVGDVVLALEDGRPGIAFLVDASGRIRNGPGVPPF